MLTAEQQSRLQHLWQTHICVPNWAQRDGPICLSKGYPWLWRPLSPKCERSIKLMLVLIDLHSNSPLITTDSLLLQVVALTMEDFKIMESSSSGTDLPIKLQLQ